MTIGIRDLRQDQVELLEAYEWFLSQDYASLIIDRHDGKVRVIEARKVKTLKDIKNLKA